MNAWILASGSPRRRELLARLNTNFRIISPNVDEWSPDEADPVHQVEENALRKGRAVRDRCPDDLVIAADTTVALANRIFGKPSNRDEAVEMLMALSGKEHQVVTGVALFWPGGSSCFHESSGVFFRPFSVAQAMDYIDRVHVYDKAGGYAIQEQRELIIESYAGSFENIMGLPIQRLRKELVQIGYGAFLIPEA